MGLVRKAKGDEVAAPSGNVDMSTMIREAVEAEIERQRLESEKRAAELPGGGG